MKRGGPLKQSELKRKKWWTPRSKKRRNWAKMSEGTWTAAGGRCEMCDRKIPNGTPYAHIIPRSAPRETSDESWNGAALCLIGKGNTEGCYSILDNGRGKAYIEMKAGDGCALLDRIQADPRLRSYYDKKEARYEYVTRSEG